MQNVALVTAKGTEYLEGMDIDDFRSQMTNKGMRWDMVVVTINLVKGITCYHSPDMYKYKWQQLLPNYKNLQKQTRISLKVYFNITIAEKKAEHTFTNFNIYV